MKSGGKDVKTLIIGANGLVGRSLSRMLTGAGIAWIGTCHKRGDPALRKLDITDETAVKTLFSGCRFDAVFNCANLAGGVNYCESHPEEASVFHLGAIQTIGAACRNAGALYVHLSTDYVFDGTKERCAESDATNPLNLYGKLKRDAEKWIIDNLTRYVIVRTTNIFGWDPLTVTPNYMMGLYRSIKEKKRFDAPSFLFGHPTYVGDIAGALIELYQKGATGIFHVVGSSFINRYDWALKACDILGLDRSLVSEVKTPPSAMIPRPLKPSLSSEKFSSCYSTVLHTLESGLELMKRDMESAAER